MVEMKCTMTFKCFFVLLQVVLSASENKYILSGLSPSTEYEVMLTAIFTDKSESDTVSVIETTSECEQTVGLGTTNSFFLVNILFEKLVLDK